MEPVRVSPLEGALNFLSAFARGSMGPHEQITTDLPDIVVDTCLAGDSNKWETGINRSKIEGEWVIVEQYPDKPTAEVGHAKWVKMLSEYPDLPVKDIDLWNLKD